MSLDKKIRTNRKKKAMYSRFLNNNEMGIEAGHQLRAQSLTLATAESCTGGTVASMVAAVAGASDYYRGGVVSYAVSVKEQVLGVTLRDGVVSQDTALQMARGAARVCGADCGVATTGVAGPGPSDGLPQGTVCIAAIWRGKNGGTSRELAQTLHLNGDREEVILQAADCALRLLVRLIGQEKEKIEG